LKDLSGSRLGILSPKSAEEAEKMAGELQEIILEACEVSISKKRVFRKSKMKKSEPKKKNNPRIKRIKESKD